MSEGSFEPGGTGAAPAPEPAARGEPSPPWPGSEAPTERLADQPPEPPLPTARELISVGIELAFRSSRSIRTASMAIGFQLLGAAGPVVLLLIVIATRAPTALDSISPGGATTIDERHASVVAAFGLTGIIALVAFVALAIESRIVAAALLGAAAAGRPLAPHEALRRSRQTFWRVVAATIIINIPITGASNVVDLMTSPLIGGSAEASLVVSLVTTTLLSIPFAYVLTAIVLGDAGAGESIRRSIGLARVRWRLALVVSVAQALAQTLLIFGLGAALDVIVTVTKGLGLGLDSGTTSTFATLVIALLGTAAVGSLIFTVTALAAAPQVVAFVGLTRYTAGLDGARDAVVSRGIRWISVPMAIGIGLALLASIGGVSAIVRPG